MIGGCGCVIMIGARTTLFVLFCAGRNARTVDLPLQKFIAFKMNLEIVIIETQHGLTLDLISKAYLCHLVLLTFCPTSLQVKVRLTIITSSMALKFKAVSDVQ